LLVKRPFGLARAPSQPFRARKPPARCPVGGGCAVLPSLRTASIIVTQAGRLVKLALPFQAYRPHTGHCARPLAATFDHRQAQKHQRPSPAAGAPSP